MFDGNSLGTDDEVSVCVFGGDISLTQPAKVRRALLRQRFMRHLHYTTTGRECYQRCVRRTSLLRMCERVHTKSLCVESAPSNLVENIRPRV